MLTTAATPRNIRLIVEAIITSHTGVALAWRSMSVRPWNEGHYFPNRRTACGPVPQISASVHNPRFFRSQVISNYEFKIVHNCLDMAATSLMYHCKYIKNFVLLLRKFAVMS